MLTGRCKTETQWSLSEKLSCFVMHESCGTVWTLHRNSADEPPLRRFMHKVKREMTRGELCSGTFHHNDWILSHDMTWVAGKTVSQGGVTCSSVAIISQCRCNLHAVAWWQLHASIHMYIYIRDICDSLRTSWVDHLENLSTLYNKMPENHLLLPLTNKNGCGLRHPYSVSVPDMLLVDLL